MQSNPTEFLPRPIAIALLIMSATLFAGNHIAARFAFDNGTGLLLAVLARSTMSLIFMLSIVKLRQASMAIPAPLRKWQVLLGFLIAAQSLCLYSAITLIPVAMALLLVNTWPMMFILASWLAGKKAPNLKTFLLLMFILFGLILVLNIDTDIPLTHDWLIGVGLATFSAMLLAATMWITQYQLAGIPGSVRSSYIMMIVVSLMLVAAWGEWLPGGSALPENETGWIGLVCLALLYAVAITTLFVLTPRLDMARNSPVLNFEPVASLFLAYGFLGQTLNSVQLIGGAIVMIGIMGIGMSRA
ncbi:MAG: DMT family transporter [Gammaproteobacteria bacterium]|nr:DMT family transporter [Gammaproteobacteria bacterium]